MTLLARLSLKARLLVGAVLWISVTLLVTGLVLTALFSRHVERRFDAELATHLDQLLANLQETGGAVRLMRPMTDPRFERPYSALYWQVDLPDGSALRSRSLWDTRLALPDDAPPMARCTGIWWPDRVASIWSRWNARSAFRAVAT